jgi:hypothetical protein
MGNFGGFWTGSYLTRIREGLPSGDSAVIPPTLQQ